MSDDLDNLVPFPRGQFASNELEANLDELPVRPKRQRPTCDHDRAGAWVNAAERRVTCRGCDVELDPIHVLERFAQRRETLVLQGRSLRNERNHLTVEVEKLKRQERNAKSRIRTARKRTAAIDADLIEQVARDMCDVKTQVGWDGLPEGMRDRWIGYATVAVEACFGAAAERATGA